MSKNYGTQRLVVGAHYGFSDWLAQRVTAVLMSVFTLVLVAQLLFGGKLGYERWSGIVSAQWMKFLAFITIVSMLYHTWVGMRDVWMDYVKPVGIKLALQVFTIAWLVGCAGWAVQVIWRL